MAKKINLRELFNTGDLIVTSENLTETGQSSGIQTLFDGNKTTNRLEINAVSGTAKETLILSFLPNIQGIKFRVSITTQVVPDYKIYLNNNLNNPYDVIANGSDTGDIATQLTDFSVNSLNQIRIELNSSPLNLRIYEIELFIMEEADPYEFNDSVLTTHAWNSSRYSGKQLSSAKINEYTAGDTTFSHTPVVSNFSRNIYIGSRVIGMREPGLGAPEDPTLTPFPGFSYVTVDDYITVNSDDSITRRSVRSGTGINSELHAKKGFYQAWYQDFPIGTNVEVRPLDTRLAQSLAPRYNIFNNSGQLQKILLVTQNHAVYSGSDAGSLDYDSGSYYAASYSTSSQIFDYCSGSGNPNGTDIGGEFSVFNNLLLVTSFFTGSLIAAPQGVNDPIPSDDLTVIPDFGGGGGIVDNTNTNSPTTVVGADVNDDGADTVADVDSEEGGSGGSGDGAGSV